VRAPGPVEKIIEQGYDLPRQQGGALFFRVGALVNTNEENWVDLLNTMAKIEYGEFNGRKAAEMLAFHGDAGYLALVEFGREYSPVLYLHFDLQRSNGPYGLSLRKLAAGDERAIDLYITGIKVEFGLVPDEVNWDPSRRCLRLWWD
jgi:hypothetical protein